MQRLFDPISKVIEDLICLQIRGHESDDDLRAFQHVAESGYDPLLRFKLFD